MDVSGPAAAAAAAGCDYHLPACTRLRPDAGSMLGHRLRRWFGIETTLNQRLVFAELSVLGKPPQTLI